MSFDIQWLSKTYNRLGRFLHAPFPDAAKHDASKIESLRSYLEEVLHELEPVLANRIDTSLANVVEFRCFKCNEPVICSVKGVQSTKRSICLDPNCSAEHIAEETKEGEFRFFLDASVIECSECNEPIEIENRLLKLDCEFTCQKCHKKFKVVSNTWHVSKVVDT